MATIEPKRPLPDPQGVRRQLGGLRKTWMRALEPRADNLPNRLVVLVPLIILLVIFVGLVTAGVTGSSTGMVASQVETGADEDLLAGQPRAIRSDEWFVQTSWVISQVEQGLPPRNESFPGGMDATVQNDLPSLDWSTAFRPQLLGFLFLPLDNAMAFKWWFPGFALIAAVYVFVVALLPRRPLLAGALAVGTFFAPFLQWWYLSLSLYPVAWAALCMATVVYCFKSRTRTGPWVLAGLTGYITATLGMGIYAPFIVPVVVVVASFSIGAFFDRALAPVRVRARLRALLPVLVAAVGGLAVMTAWILTRLETIRGFTDTVYPGERLQAVGGADLNQLAQLFSAVFSFGLGSTRGQPFTVNESEASTFFLPGLFLIPVLVWILIREYRRRDGIRGTIVGLLIGTSVMFCFLYIPGWDGLAHALFLDRTTYSRMRIGFGVMSIAMVVVCCWRLGAGEGRSRLRAPRTVAGVSSVAALASVALIGYVAYSMVGLDALRSIAYSDRLVGAIFVVALVASVWLIARGRATAAAITLMVIAIGQSSFVNPLYEGVFDLRQTQTVRAIQSLNEQRPGSWIGISTSLLPTMMLVESGVRTYNGVQGFPSPEMWSAIDPSGTYEEEWNRLATVGWVPGQGDPKPTNPAPDQVRLNFDSCASFAQEHVEWVLSEVPLDQMCLIPEQSVVQGPSTFMIYQVSK